MLSLKPNKLYTGVVESSLNGVWAHRTSAQAMSTIPTGTITKVIIYKIYSEGAAVICRFRAQLNLHVDRRAVN